MTIKEIWSKTNHWLKVHKIAGNANSPPEVDDEGLIAQDSDSPQVGAAQQGTADERALTKPAQRADKAQSLEKLQAGFDALIDRLQSINEHLNRQVTQHEELMGRIEQLPQLLEGFPALLENQKRITEELLEQLKSAAAKDQQFIDAVERIPNETAKQTDALVNIDHQLAAAADLDVQAAESFNKFNETLEKLNQSTMSQTDGIVQMSKTYATSDRYLKYIMSRQNKRFTWVFVIAISVCAAVVLILAGIIIYLRR
jgi:chromosome segregation ATPase